MTEETRPEKTDDASYITITDKAVEKVIVLSKEKGHSDAVLRVFVVGGGCSGYQYGMAFIDLDDIEETDHIVEQQGVTIVVDEESVSLLQGAEIGYAEDLMNSGFTVHNPNATSSCACGSSFQAKAGGGTPRQCT